MGRRLIALAIIGFFAFVGYWFYSRYQLAVVQADVTRALGDFEAELKKVTVGMPTVTRDHVKAAVLRLATRHGAELATDAVEVLAQQIEVERISTGGVMEVDACRVKQYPTLWSAIGLARRTAFEIAVKRCAMERWVVGFRATIPIARGTASKTFEVERYTLVRSFSDS